MDLWFQTVHVDRASVIFVLTVAEVVLSNRVCERLLRFLRQEAAKPLLLLYLKDGWMFWAFLQLINWFADVNLFSVIELCSNGCRGLNISQLLGPRATDIRLLGLCGCWHGTVHDLNQLTGEARSVFGGWDEPRAGCASSGVWCAGVLCSIRGLWCGRMALGDIFFAVGSSSLRQQVRPGVQLQTLISEQEVSWSRRLGEFNKCFFTGKQRKLLFKLLLVRAPLMLNRPWLCLKRDAALSCYNFIKVDLWCFTFW